MSLIFVDVEATGRSPYSGVMTEFGCVEYETRETFHGVLFPAKPLPSNPAQSVRTHDFGVNINIDQVFADFETWIKQFPGGYSFVSDNPAYDFQWMSYYLDRYLGYNPFGHSARRISDFWAGLNRDWRKTQEWKRFRRTKHDHHPVHDALGNVEAYEEIMRRMNNDEV